jgi:hypothetical protein
MFIILVKYVFQEYQIQVLNRTINSLSTSRKYFMVKILHGENTHKEEGKSRREKNATDPNGLVGPLAVINVRNECT